MNKESQVANSKKITNGLGFESQVAGKIKSNKKIKQHSLRCQKSFYYTEKTVAEKIAETLENPNEKDIERAVMAYIKANKEHVYRDKNKNCKRADITFVTDSKYFVNGKLGQVRFFIDTTTSARGDRIKAKAQDAEIYEKFGFKSVYLIVLPDDEFFDKNGYANPTKEKNSCKNTVYRHNFRNLHKDEKVSLIVQESDLINFLEYIQKRPKKDMETLIKNWKKLRYPDFVAKEKKEIENEYKKLVLEVKGLCL